jgi:hypothetical protein
MTQRRSAKQVEKRMALVDASQGLSITGMSLAPMLIKCHKARSLAGIVADNLSFWLRKYAVMTPWNTMSSVDKCGS